MLLLWLGEIIRPVTFSRWCGRRPARRTGRTALHIRPSLLHLVQMVLAEARVQRSLSS